MFYPAAMLSAVAAAALICLDPGHGTVPAIGAQTEPIAPGSHVMKIKDGGGAPGEAPVALAIAFKLRTLLLRDGYRVAMTRTKDGYRGGNIERAQFCNARHAALMLRIHADGSTNTATHGISTLYKRGYRRPAVLMERALTRTTGAPDRGVVLRTDLTGFNWATVPAILVECGFMSNPAERARLQSAAYQQTVARGLAAGVSAFVRV
jgi:N-acetylmuramoyl-L-alanine amidase